MPETADDRPATETSTKHIVVVGGSVAGLGAALVLSSEGHRVTVLEQEANAMPASPVEAFESWDRKGSPQTRHSHAFLARLRGILARRAPELLDTLLAHGAEELPFEALARNALGRDDLEFEPEDAELTLIACRRITFEWVLRRHVLDTGRVAFRTGAQVVGLATGPGPANVPHVVGVRLAPTDGDAGEAELLQADLVLDATGRRSKLHHWLADAGAKVPRRDSEPCGIFYCSRFYKTLDGGDRPELGGVAASDLGFMKYGIFPGDNGIFSITLCASPHDDELRSLLRTECFDAATRAIPATEPWVDPAVSTPISDVHPMGGLKNTRVWFVEDDMPCATGFFPIGDALIHTNPLNGRGCTLAFVNAELVAEALAAEPDDPLAFARALDAGVCREIVPWYEATRGQDRDGISVAKEQQRGEDPYAYRRDDDSVDMRKYMRVLIREGLLPAMREDLTLLRAFARIFNLLDQPSDLMKDPRVMQSAVAALAARESGQAPAREPDRAEPDRETVVAVVADARARAKGSARGADAAAC